jgi:hypothetical protein
MYDLKMWLSGTWTVFRNGHTKYNFETAKKVLNKGNIETHKFKIGTNNYTVNNPRKKNTLNTWNEARTQASLVSLTEKIELNLCDRIPHAGADFFLLKI